MAVSRSSSNDSCLIRCTAFFVYGLAANMQGKPMTTDRLLNTQQAANMLGLSPNTLNQWRHDGRPPRFRKLGKAVRYLESDLLEYIEQKARESTSRQNLQTY